MLEKGALVVEIFAENANISFGAFDRNDSLSSVRRYFSCRKSWQDIHSIAALFPFTRESNFQSAENDSCGLSTAGSILWNTVFPLNIREIILASDRHYLILLVDEQLSFVPWELAYDGRDFLNARFSCGRVIRSMSAAFLNPPKKSNFPLRALIIADPAGGLPSAYSEGLAVKELLLRREDISVDFKSCPTGRLFLSGCIARYDLVHFCGHCFCDDSDINKSGWLMSDGVFAVSDILQSGENCALPGFIFANACVSAASREEVMRVDRRSKSYALAPAFIFSGTRHYIGAFSVIGDEQGKLLALDFYRRLLSGRSIGDALRFAQAALRRSELGESCSWSRYLLYGIPEKIFLKPAQSTQRRFYSRLKALTTASLMTAVFLFGPAASSDQGNYRFLIQGRRLLKSGDYVQAEAVLNEVLSRDPGCLPAYPLLAESYERSGQRDKALKCYYDYAVYCQRSGYKPGLSRAYSGIGWSYHLQGQYSQAVEFYHKAAELAKECGDRLCESAAIRKLAVWHIDNGDQDKALELLIKSSELNRERQWLYRHRYNLACDYFDMGLVFVNKDDYAAAKRFYIKSMRLFAGLGAGHELSDCYMNIGEVFFYEKDYRMALKNYKQGLQLDMKYGNLPKVAGDYNMFGELYLKIGDLPEAEKAFLSAEANAFKAGALPELAEAYHNLGRLCKLKRQRIRAREYLRQAQSIYRKIDIPAYQGLRQDLAELD